MGMPVITYRGQRGKEFYSHTPFPPMGDDGVHLPREGFAEGLLQSRPAEQARHQPELKMGATEVADHVDKMEPVVVAPAVG